MLAIGDLKKALKIDPSLASAHLLIARLQALPGGDREQAVKEAQQAYDLSKDKPEEQVQALVLQAGLSEDPEKKLDYFDQALKIAPNNEQALHQRGMFLLLSGKVKEAISDLDASAKADPENPEIQEVRGLALLMLKRNSEAIDAFSKEIKLSPDAAAPYLQRARAYARRQKEQGKALDDIDQALKIDPDTPKQVAAAFFLRAQVEQQAGDAKAARVDLDKALKSVPGPGHPLWNCMPSLSAGDKDYSQAIIDLKELLKIAPKSPELLANWPRCTKRISSLAKLLPPITTSCTSMRKTLKRCAAAPMHI